MTTLMQWHIDLFPWYVFAAYWAISALRVKRTKAAERSADRIATLAVMAMAFFLLFDDRLRTGPLDRRFVPSHPWIFWLGVLIASAGVAVAVWARHCIGEYWSARVTLKEDHRLIRSGPYRWVRHPIYTGLLVGTVGRALTIGQWRGAVAVALILVAHWRKALREESLLTKEFGDEYVAYRNCTGF